MTNWLASKIQGVTAMQSNSVYSVFRDTASRKHDLQLSQSFLYAVMLLLARVSTHSEILVRLLRSLRKSKEEELATS